MTRRTILCFNILLVLGYGLPAAGQGRLLGVVQTTGGLPLPAAEILVQSESTGARWKTLADAEGKYFMSALPSGLYKVTVRLAGFRTVTRVGMVLESHKAEQLDFEMDLIALHEMITVLGGRDDLDPSGGESLLLTRDTPGANLPANSRDFRSLFDLMPGVAIVPAAVNDAGQFTLNGQRPNTNTFRVDGVSVNTGVGGSGFPGSFPGATLPAMTAIGTTENVVSPENTQSVELRTSSFAPEFGERPGAGSFVTTRSGTNELHGSLFGRWRDISWNARDWFANSRGLAFPRPHHRNIGGVFGGPLWSNRTFFFLSAEQSQVTDSGLQLTVVPSMAARRDAPEELESIMDWFPPPTGPDLGGGQAEALVPLRRTGKSSSYGLRIDHSFGASGTLFTRLVFSPSWATSHYLAGSESEFNWASATGGITVGRFEGVIHDLRFNVSRSSIGSSWQGSPSVSAFSLASVSDLDRLTSFLGSAPGYFYSTYAFGLSVPGLGQFVSGGYGGNRQERWEIRDTFSGQLGRHQFRAGIDYSQIRLSRDGVISSALSFASSLQSLLDGGPLPIVYSRVPEDGGRIHALSTFVQDTYRMREALNLVYGVRWEVTPPTADRLQIPTVSGLWTGSDWQTIYTGDISGAGPWPMRYGQVAPRIGLAYRLPRSGAVLRAGAGMFFDTSMGSAINPSNGAPFNSWQLRSGGTGIRTAARSSSTAGVPLQDEQAHDVARFLYGPQPELRLPTSHQWRVSLEKGLGSRGVASMAYVGAKGSQLLGNQAYIESDTGLLRRQVTLTQNASSYHSLQLRYSGSVTPNLHASASYAWSHSIDDGSLNSSVFLIHPGYNLSDARGSSNFDLRQTLTATFSYQVPRSFGARSLPDWVAGWTLSGIFRARSGFPINIANTERELGRAFDNVGRPDLVQGVPIWIGDPTAPGSRRLNPAAFADPVSGRKGTLGRNAISGNGLAQLDASVRRDFGLRQGMSLQIEVDVFNVLNHPAFADPVPFRSSPLFGLPTSMRNLMLGLGTPNGGLPALFHAGGSRSAEFSIRLSF